MDSIKIIEILAYSLPSLITGGVAFFLFNSYFKDQQNTRRWLLQKDSQPAILPLRLQAYERLTLLMERINPSQMMVRVTPLTTDKADYQNLVIAQIDQEFEHNLSQQIYVSEECWTIIMTAKNATIQLIRVATQNDKVTDADSLRAFIVGDFIEKPTPSSAALSFLKNEVGQLW
ncbi:hypothetical protein RCH18_002270 [Flavobacterium sp. PL11]|uniref:DUF7935 family protein n=1 Tax=Flavobacterium sp. PL11 TaxID=3071717 RepID=UPI002DFC38BE|nr:hypothetical protein [Flavobacterium sp. PL11]